LKYLKEKNKKIFKMNNNMVIVLSNLRITMCHAFIGDEIQMLTIVTFDIDYSKGDNVKATVATTKLTLDSP
jgi:hypothetical protein